jgi:hypothetical protein
MRTAYSPAVFVVATEANDNLIISAETVNRLLLATQLRFSPAVPIMMIFESEQDDNEQANDDKFHVVNVDQATGCESDNPNAQKSYNDKRSCSANKLCE